MTVFWALLAIPVLFVVLGVVFAVIGTRMLRGSRRFRAVARTAPGVVTGLRYRHSGESSGSWVPVLRFTTATGVEVETEARSSVHRRTQEGQAVVVLYDPQRPLSADVEGAGRGSGLVSGLFVAMGSGFAVVGVVVLAVVATVATS